MTAPPLTFPEWARQLRAFHSMTQVEFAQLVGVHPMTVSKWERGVEIPKSWSSSATTLIKMDAAARGSESVDRGQYETWWIPWGAR